MATYFESQVNCAQLQDKCVCVEEQHPIDTKGLPYNDSVLTYTSL
jgi:hypothetical protein